MIFNYTPAFGGGIIGFNDGKEVKRFVGVQTKDKLIDAAAEIE